MGTTAKLALRYPASTDRVADGAVAMQHLAEDVDTPLGLLVNPPRCRVYLTANLTPASGTVATPVAFTSEDVDTDTMHSTTVNTSRVTINTPGRYRITAQTAFSGNATGSRGMHILKNGSMIAATVGPGTSATNQYQQATTDVVLAAGDYIELGTYQNSGVALTQFGGATATWLDVCRVGAS